MSESGWAERFWSKVEKTDGCWLWRAAHNSEGYGRFKLNGQLILTHRLSYEIANGAIPDGLFVLHECDTPSCVKPAHLFLGTNARNMLDMFAKGRRDMTGTKSTSARLTEEQVAQIRSFYARGGISHRKLGALYSISKTQIGSIIRGECWQLPSRANH